MWEKLSLSAVARLPAESGADRFADLWCAVVCTVPYTAAPVTVVCTTF